MCNIYKLIMGVVMVIINIIRDICDQFIIFLTNPLDDDTIGSFFVVSIIISSILCIFMPFNIFPNEHGDYFCKFFSYILSGMIYWIITFIVQGIYAILWLLTKYYIEHYKEKYQYENR